MNRSALVVALISLLDCGMPFQLLIHNDLSEDAEITVRWYQSYEGKERAQDQTLVVPKGRAEQASLWYGPPEEEKGIDFLWTDRQGSHRLHVAGDIVTRDVYHAYLGTDRVRFEERDAWDRIHEALTGLAAPFWWCCILSTVVPGFIVVKRRSKSHRPHT